MIHAQFDGNGKMVNGYRRDFPSDWFNAFSAGKNWLRSTKAAWGYIHKKRRLLILFSDCQLYCDQFNFFCFNEFV